MKVACYTRVSTQDQNLDRQLKSVRDYAFDRLGANHSTVRIFRDKSTGTNTDRSDYKEMMDAVEAGEFDAVVSHSVSRISRSIRDLDRTVERIVEESQTALHIISEGFELVPGDDDPFQKATLRLLGVFAELEADMAQKRTKEGLNSRMASDEYHHGPPPLGFNKEDGELYAAENYDNVVSVLEMVQKGELSKRKAAGQLDSSRRTINRALDRAELYGL